MKKKNGQDFESALAQLGVEPLKVLQRIHIVTLPPLAEEKVKELKSKGWVIEKNQKMSYA